jgi:hypothetical protein
MEFSAEYYYNNSMAKLIDANIEKLEQLMLKIQHASDNGLFYIFADSLSDSICYILIKNNFIVDHDCKISWNNFS